MKNRHLTRLRVQGDELWTTGPDVLAISPAQAAEEALREKAIERGELWMHEATEVEAALDTKTEPKWERFLLIAKRRITITTP